MKCLKKKLRKNNDSIIIGLVYILMFLLLQLFDNPFHYNRHFDSKLKEYTYSKYEVDLPKGGTHLKVTISFLIILYLIKLNI